MDDNILLYKRTTKLLNLINNITFKRQSHFWEIAIYEKGANNDMEEGNLEISPSFLANTVYLSPFTIIIQTALLANSTCLGNALPVKRLV